MSSGRRFADSNGFSQDNGKDIRKDVAVIIKCMDGGTLAVVAKEDSGNLDFIFNFFPYEGNITSAEGRVEYLPGGSEGQQAGLILSTLKDYYTERWQDSFSFSIGALEFDHPGEDWFNLPEDCSERDNKKILGMQRLLYTTEDEYDEDLEIALEQGHNIIFSGIFDDGQFQGEPKPKIS